MKLKLKDMLMAAVTATAFTALADSDMPGFWHDTNEPWTAKYYYAPLNTTTPPEDWYTSEFDDSEWETIEGAISSIEGDGATKWAADYSAYWLRCHFNLTDPEKLIVATLKTYHDDGCRIYLNGKKIYDVNAVVNPANETEVSPSSFKAGDNVLAVYVADTGRVEAFIDFGLSPVFMDEVIEVDVPTPGTMGDVILGKADDFVDVKALRISGKLNSTDVETLKNRLTNLRYLDMGKAELKELGNSALRGKAKLRQVILPENLQTIGEYAFCNCYALSEVVFQESLKTIGRYAFQSTALKEVKLPEGLTSLGEYAFIECAQNKYVSLPSTLKTIPHGAFLRNYALEDIDFKEGLETIGGSAFDMSYSNYTNELTTLVFPSSLKTISENAFVYNKKLRDVKFNEGLTRIGDNAFYDCDSLKEVTLPSTLVRADASPFDYCDNLRKVTCLSIEPPYMTDQIPNGCGMEGRELYVPSMALNVYKQTTGWDKFSSIKPIDSYPDDIIINRDQRLTLLENLPAGYKPDFSLDHFYLDNRWNYGRLELNGVANVTLRKFSMVWDPNVSASYNPFTALINNVNMRADSLEVAFYQPSNRWAFISFPYDVRVGDITSCAEGTTSFVIRRYSGANRAAGESGSTWQDMNDDDIMKAGEGYILQSTRYIGNSRQSYTGLRFPSTDSENLNNAFLTTDATTVLEEHPSEQDHNRGWNLTGNPYPCYYDSRFMSLEAPVTVWDADYSTYRVYSPLDDSYVFTPGEAFFVQCPAGKPQIVFDVEGRQKTRAVRELSTPARIAAPANGRKIFNLTLSSQTGEDAARIVFNEDASFGYEAMRDAAKFFSPEESVGQLFTVASDVEYAINERPLADGQVALGVRIGGSGTYTIALDGDSHVYKVWLDDAATGDSVRLDASAGYEFTAEPGMASERFTLRFVAEDVTSVGTIGSESMHAVGSGIYTIDGRSVKEPESGSIYIQNGKKVVK